MIISYIDLPSGVVSATLDARLAVLQGGEWFVSDQSATASMTCDPGCSATPVTLTVDDFAESAFDKVSVAGGLDSGSHPDFGDTGPLLRFGIAIDGSWSGPWYTASNRYERSFQLTDYELTVYTNDADDDGTVDIEDFCSEDDQAPSPCGYDTDGDGFGNHCDGDFNNDGATDFSDVDLFAAALSDNDSAGVGADMNCDGAVDFNDVGVFADQLGAGVPGPSGLPCSATFSCP